MISAFVEAVEKSHKAFIWNRFVALGILEAFCLECLEFAVFPVSSSAIKHPTICSAGIL